MTDTSQPDAFPKGGDNIVKSTVDITNTRTFVNYVKKYAEDKNLDTDQRNYQENRLLNPKNLIESISDYQSMFGNLFDGSEKMSDSSGSSSSSGAQPSSQ